MFNFDIVILWKGIKGLTPADSFKYTIIPTQLIQINDKGYQAILL